jgi:hypothetical protein
MSSLTFFASQDCSYTMGEVVFKDTEVLQEPQLVPGLQASLWKSDLNFQI